MSISINDLRSRGFSTWSTQICASVWCMKWEYFANGQRVYAMILCVLMYVLCRCQWVSRILWIKRFYFFPILNLLRALPTLKIWENFCHFCSIINNYNNSTYVLLSFQFCWPSKAKHMVCIILINKYNFFWYGLEIYAEKNQSSSSVA